MSLPRFRPLVPFAVLCCATFLVLAAEGPPVRFTPVTEHEMRGEIRLPATVEPTTAGVVAGEVAGRVVEIVAREGQRVAAGSALVRIDSTNVELQLRAARGRLKEARARLELAESKLGRAQHLFDGSVISQDELDDAMSESTAWLGRVDQTEAEIARFEEDLRRSEIRAPFSGVIVRKMTEVGQWVALGGAVAEMVSLDRLELRVEVPERHFVRLEHGDRTAILFESLPGLRLEGKIEAVIPRADPVARTFPVKVRFRDPEGRVGVGMLAEVALPVGESRRALLLPKDAVVRQGLEEVVYRINEDDTVEPVSVKSGQGVGDWIVVDGPLVAGQRVVTRGNERLMPGQQVSPTAQEYRLP
ncbi:MAG: efflux RND transporter periplasmic adaptor subunit [bacterium]|nr:efflux RND transporter periplasmic adaptor subunit [bacterium]